MRDFIRKHEVWIFLVSIVIAQAVFILSVAQGILPRGIYSMGRFYLLASILVAIVFVARGIPGLIALIRPMFNLKVPPIWYFLALMWAPGLAILLLLGKGILNGQGIGAVTADFTLMSQPRMIYAVLTASFIGEIVWISYAIGQISKKFPPFMASQIVGAFWAIWWVPIALFGQGIVPEVPMFALTINMLAVAAICCFFYNQTHSAFCVWVLQSVFNASLLIFPVIPTNGGEATYTAYTILYWIVALVMFLIMGPKPLLARSAAPARA